MDIISKNDTEQIRSIDNVKQTNEFSKILDSRFSNVIFFSMIVGFVSIIPSFYFY